MLKEMYDVKEEVVEFVSKLNFNEDELTTFRKKMQEFQQEWLSTSTKHMMESMIDVMCIGEAHPHDPPTNEESPEDISKHAAALSSDDEFFPMPGSWF